MNIKTNANAIQIKLNSAHQPLIQNRKNAGTDISRSKTYAVEVFRHFALLVSAQRPIVYQKTTAKQRCRHAHLKSKGELRRQPSHPFGKNTSETAAARIVAGTVPSHIAVIGAGGIA